MGAMCHHHHHQRHGCNDRGGSGLLLMLGLVLTLLMLPYLFMEGEQPPQQPPCITCAIAATAVPGPLISVSPPLVFALVLVPVLLLLLLNCLCYVPDRSCDRHHVHHRFNACTGSFVSNTPHVAYTVPADPYHHNDPPFTLPSEPSLFLWGLLGMFFILISIHFSS